MKVLVIRSPYLVYSRETINGYRYPSCGTDVRLYRRSHDLGDVDELNDVIRRGSYTHVLDLSCSFDADSGVSVPLYNSRPVHEAVTTPGSLRRTMPEALPPATEDQGPHWIKGPGEGGTGKVFHEGRCDIDCYTATPERYDYNAPWPTHGGPNMPLPLHSDIQLHIEGQEYRVNTVGDRIVQAHLKGNRVYDGRNTFDYEWCGVDGIRTNGTIPLIKEAVLAIPNWDTSVLAWDIIVGSGGPYVIEVNTSPGMNPATARRIYSELH